MLFCPELECQNDKLPIGFFLALYIMLYWCLMAWRVLRWMFNFELEFYNLSLFQYVEFVREALCSLLYKTYVWSIVNITCLFLNSLYCNLSLCYDRIIINI